MPDLSRVVWRKASRSNNQGGNCVEVATGTGWHAIRDSKLGAGGPILSVTPAQFTTLLDKIKNDELDR